jgi:hypothetical protein
MCAVNCGFLDFVCESRSSPFGQVTLEEGEEVAPPFGLLAEFLGQCGEPLRLLSERLGELPGHSGELRWGQMLLCWESVDIGADEQHDDPAKPGGGCEAKSGQLVAPAHPDLGGEVECPGELGYLEAAEELHQLDHLVVIEGAIPGLGEEAEQAQGAVRGHCVERVCQRELGDERRIVVRESGWESAKICGTKPARSTSAAIGRSGEAAMRTASRKASSAWAIFGVPPAASTIGASQARNGCAICEAVRTRG